MYVCSFPREQRTREQSAADENGADGARRRWQRFVNSRFLAACGEKEREECRGLRKVRGERESVAGTAHLAARMIKGIVY